MPSNEKSLSRRIIFYGIPSIDIVQRNISSWIMEAGEPDVFVVTDESLYKYKSKLLDQYDVISFKEAMEHFPDADVYVTWNKAAATAKMLTSMLPAEKIHFLEDKDSETKIREMENRNNDSSHFSTAITSTESNITEIEHITPEFLSMIKLPDEKCKQLNYLLVMPIMPEVPAFEFIFQVGIAYVSSALKASGRKVFILNLDLNSSGNPYDLLENEIIKNKIDVVMTGGVSLQFWKIKKIIDVAKMTSPNIVTIVGGILITADPQPVMQALKNADYGVIGEGEITINSLAYALETNNYTPDIDGIVFRRDNKWVVREKYPAIHDLGILPYPDYEGFGYSKYIKKASEYHKRAFINSSRSCTNRCTFCFSKHGKYRRMEIDDVFKLLDWMFSLYPDIRRLHMGDEISFSDPEYAIEFSRRIKPYNLSWRCSLRVDKKITSEMLAAMKDSGNDRILIGIESADNNVLKSMRKRITIEQVEDAIALANEVGATMDGNLIFGDLEEDMNSIIRSLNWYIKHNKNVKGVFMIRVHPGSPLYEIACERNLIKNRVKYVKSYMLPKAKPVNLSKLTESEFVALTSLLNFFNRLQGEDEGGLLKLPTMLEIMNKLEF